MPGIGAGRVKDLTPWRHDKTRQGLYYRNNQEIVLHIYRIYENHGLIQANFDNGIPIFGAPNLGAQIIALEINNKNFFTAISLSKYSVN